MEPGFQNVMGMNTMLKALDAKPEGLKFILQVTGTIDNFEVGNSIIKYQFSK